jgi:ATP-dependent protease ClpP protease subunit
MQIHTLCIGAAAGHACLVLAAGKKGKRYMFPHAKGSTLLTLLFVGFIGKHFILF